MKELSNYPQSSDFLNTQWQSVTLWFIQIVEYTAVFKTWCAPGTLRTDLKISRDSLDYSLFSLRFAVTTIGPPVGLDVSLKLEERPAA